MMSWLIRRKIDDDDGGEMLNEKSDIELNVVDVIGEMDPCRHKSTVAEIVTVGSGNSRGGESGRAGYKEARERERETVEE